MFLSIVAAHSTSGSPGSNLINIEGPNPPCFARDLVHFPPEVLVQNVYNAQSRDRDPA